MLTAFNKNTHFWVLIFIKYAKNSKNQMPKISFLKKH